MTRGNEKAVWERFRAACDKFFTRRQEDLKQRKQDWTENLKRKEALVAEAKQLSESTEWEQAASRIKRLQADWKTIGPVKKSKSDAIWNEFRAACDLFFERFKNRDQVALQGKMADREIGRDRARSAAAAGRRRRRAAARRSLREGAGRARALGAGPRAAASHAGAARRARQRRVVRAGHALARRASRAPTSIPS